MNEMYELILEDFGVALEDLEASLLFSGKKNDMIRSAIVEDAQIHYFLRAVITLKAYLWAFFDETEADVLEFKSDVLFLMMKVFYEEEIITKQQFDDFGELFAYQAFFQRHRIEFGQDAVEVERYTTGVKAIPRYYRLMCEFFSALIDNERELPQGDEIESEY